MVPIDSVHNIARIEYRKIPLRIGHSENSVSFYVRLIDNIRTHQALRIAIAREGRFLTNFCPSFQLCTSGAPLKPLRVPALSRETSVSRTANVGTVGKNWLQKRNGGQK